MANATDPSVPHVHGVDPQSLIDKILRMRVYDSPYWKEHCFGLNAATIIDRAVLLDHVGGVYGGHALPCPFLCLALKLLQIGPPLEAVEEFMLQAEYKYLRLLGAFYYRLVARSADVWTRLEPLLSDYRRVRRRKEDGGWEVVHVDEVVDDMLQLDKCMSIALPRLVRREVLVQRGSLEERRSALLDIMQQEEEEGEDDEGHRGKQQQKPGEARLLMPGEQEMKDNAQPIAQPSDEQKSGAAAAVPHTPAALPNATEAAQKQAVEKRRRSRDRDRDESGGRSPNSGHGHRSQRREREEDRRHRRRPSSSSSRSPSRDRHRQRDDDRYERRHHHSNHDRHSSSKGRQRHRDHSPSSSRSRSRSPRHHRRRSRS